MEVALFLFYFLLFSYLLYKWKFLHPVPFLYSQSLFIVKTIAGLSGGYLYMQYLDGGDTHTYMIDAITLFESLKSSPSHFFQLVIGIEWQQEALQQYYSQLRTNAEPGYGHLFNNSMLFVRLNAVLCCFSQGYYSIHVLFMCFLSLTGLIALYKALNSNFNPVTFILINTIPGLLLWGSMMLKEPLVLFLLGFSIYHFQRSLLEINTGNVIGFLVCFFFLMLMKSFIALLLFPALTAWIIFTLWNKKWLPVFTLTISSFILILIILSVTDKFNVFQAMHHQQIVFLKFAVYYQANSLIELIPFSPDAFSVIKRSPEALLTAFRPFPGEAKNFLQFIAAMENIYILLLTAFLISRAKMMNLKYKPEVAICISTGVFILIVASFTTPVIGALVRIKMPGILLLIAGLTAGITNDWRKDGSNSFNL